MVDEAAEGGHRWLALLAADEDDEEPLLLDEPDPDVQDLAMLAAGSEP
jgi:hypothetical protein